MANMTEHERGKPTGRTHRTGELFWVWRDRIWLGSRTDEDGDDG